MLVLAGEGTPLQAVISGIVWTAWFGCVAIWPRQALVLSRRWSWWNRRSFGDPAFGLGPKGATDWEPSRTLVIAYRAGSVVLTGFGIYLTAQGISRY